MIRGGSLIAIPVCAALSCGLATAQVPPASHTFEGAWVWDPNQNRAPFDVGPDVKMSHETMMIVHDDGAHWVARIDQVYTNGTGLTYAEDFPEDGELHEAGPKGATMMVAIAVEQDGGRHVISYRSGNFHDAHCYVAAGGMQLTCEGTDKQHDGTTGHFVCVYHRDPYTVPVAVALPPPSR